MKTTLLTFAFLSLTLAANTVLAETIAVNPIKANILSKDLKITAAEVALACEKKSLLGGVSVEEDAVLVSQISQDHFVLSIPSISVSAFSGYHQCNYRITFEFNGRVASFSVASEGLQPGSKNLVYFKDAAVITSLLTKALNGAELIKDDSKFGGADLKLRN